jgi:alpha-ribazole phosphatase
MALHVIRHTTPKVTPGMCYGSLDLDVTDQFSDEADAVRSQLRVNFSQVYSSPLKRCVDLADYIGFPYVVDARLREMDFGYWEGKLWTEIDPIEMQAWKDDIVEYRIPGGENFRDVVDRVSAFLEILPAGETLLVTHAGVIKALRILREGLLISEGAFLPSEYGDYVCLP